MDDDLLQAMTLDLHNAIGYTEIPERAMQIKDLMKSSDLSYEFTRRAIQKLVASGEWKKGRRGNLTFYWKVMSEDG